MAAVAVVFDGTRLSGAESESDGGTWDKLGVTQSPTQETDFILQGTFEISNKVSSGTDGVDFDDDATVDFSTTPKVVLAKIQITTASLINVSLAKGVAYYIGSSGSDYYEYNLWGSVEGSYPERAGWQVIAIDPNVSGYRDATTGTPALGSVDYYGLYADITASVKSENVVHSALDYLDSGTGLTLTGGDGADADGTFDDYVSTDAGNSSNRWFVASQNESEIIVFGVLTIGTATATVFTDSLKTIVFPDARVNAGFFGFNIDLQNGSTLVSITNSSFTSNGTVATADTRAILDVTGTSGLCSFSTCNFVAFASITLTNAADMPNSVIDSSGLVTAAGASMTDTTISNSTVAADASALNWDVATDPNNFLKGMRISIGTNAHHAIEFGTTSPLTMTLTDMAFTGFNASNAQNDSTFYIARTSGTVTINLSGVTGNTSYKTAGATVVILQSVLVTITVLEDITDSPINLAHVQLYLTSDYSTEVLSGATNASGVISGSWTGSTPVDVEGWARQMDLAGTDYEPEDIAGEITSSGLTLTVKLKPLT